MKYVSGWSVRSIYTWLGWSGEVAEPIGTTHYCSAHFGMWLTVFHKKVCPIYRKEVKVFTKSQIEPTRRIKLLHFLLKQVTCFKILAV